MRYSGGKAKTSGPLCAAIKSVCGDARAIVEPFCGGLSMTVRLQPREASDISRPVITLVDAVRSGWVPPTKISEEEYANLRLRRDDHHNPLVCFAGLCASFGGKWFGGLARSHPNQLHPVATSGVTLMRRVRQCASVNFRCADYRDASVKIGDAIYCDPPYRGTTHAYATGVPFNSDDFWAWATDMSSQHLVMVSEFAAPPEWHSVWSMDRKVTARRDGSVINRKEQLWVMEKNLPCP